MKKNILFVFLAIAAVAVAVKAKDSAGDDAFITLRVAQNALLGKGLHFNATEPAVQVCTSPLNLILTTAIAFVTSKFGVSITESCQLSPFIISLFAIPILLFGTMRLISPKLTGDFGIAGATLALLGTLLLSTIGLETILFLAFCVWSLVFLETEKYLSMGIALGLAFLSRHDALILLFLILIYLMFFKKPENGIIPVLGPIILIVAPWLLFSAVYYGQTVPSTLKSKLAQGGSIYWPEPFYSGFWNSMVSNFWNSSTAAGVASFLAILGLAFAFKQKQTNLIFLFIFAITHFAAYSILRLPQYHWYYVPYIVIISIFAGIAVNQLCKNINFSAWLATAGLIFGVLLSKPEMDSRFVPYKEAGEYLNQNPPTYSVGMMEIGIVGFFAPKAKIFDFSGLATLSQIESVREGRAAKWLDNPQNVDKVLIRGEMHPLEPDIRSSFKSKYLLEKSFPPSPQFKNGLQIWKLQNE